MDKINIPPEALEKAAIDLLGEINGWDRETANGHYCWLHPREREALHRNARAACLAMLENWPNSVTVSESEPTWINRNAIILPLTENSNERE